MRLFKLVSALLLLVLVVSACAPAAAPTPTAAPKVAAPSPTEAPKATTPPQPTQAPVAKATEAPKATAVPQPTAAPAAGAVKDVPRNRTFITGGWDLYNQVPSPTNFHPYAGVLLHERNSLHLTVYESLFYSNYATGETIGWLGESWAYNKDFTEITIKLRKGVKWADGQPFTAKDVVYTIGMLQSNAPAMLMSSVMKEWVKEAKAVDDLTVQIVLTKPGPRWAVDNLATGQAARLVIVPEHVWKDKDTAKFENFDLAKGWPLGTGPYKLVKSGNDSIAYDLPRHLVGRRDRAGQRDAEGPARDLRADHR